jgi:hypothetical protein
MKNYLRSGLSSEHGAALVVTLIVLVVLAVVAVAFMQNTGLDRAGSRSAANVYRARLAAEAGLAEAMVLIEQNAANFAYATGSRPLGNGYETFIRRLKTEDGAWQFDGDVVPLHSGIGDGVDIILTGSMTEPGLRQNVAWKAPSLSGDPDDSASPSARYAFWVDEAGAKQNLAWWGGGAAAPVGTALTNLAQIQPLLPDEGGQTAASFPGDALDAIVDERVLEKTNFSFGDKKFTDFVSKFPLPTVATVNLASDELEGRVNSFFFTASSPSGATTPAGTPKLNLAALARYVNQLTTAQGDGSPKAELVELLLKEDPGNAAEAWGGGSLSWLAACKKYSETEQKQIVANIIDYLDDDIIPTTDNVDTPTYFGVEMKLTDEGTIRGHPLVNYVTFGLIFNRNTNSTSENFGKINSTRVLCSAGVVYPWSAKDGATADYEAEISVDVEGEVVNGLGVLGNAAPPYFKTDLDENLANAPTGKFDPFSGYNFPQDVGIAGTANYATRTFGHSATPKDWPERLPSNILFKDIKFEVKKFRLKFTPSDGSDPGYVCILPGGLKAELDEPDISPGLQPGTTGDPSPFFMVKITSSTGGDYSKSKNIYLTSDPRKHFSQGSWESMQSKVPFGNDIPPPADGITAIDVYGGAKGADGKQDVDMNFEWFKDPELENHLSRFSDSGMTSTGELGYIWTGKPWQTLNLVDVSTPKTADWNLLDYVAMGRLADNQGNDAIDGDDPGVTAVSTLPLHAPLGTSVGMKAGLLSQGGFNINTRKQPTLQAVLASSPGASKAAAEQIGREASGSQASAYGEIASLAAAVPGIVAGPGPNKFQREAAQRALAGIAVNHSRVFTVYSVGEYRQGKSASRVQLEADIFVGVDSKSGQPQAQIINQRFL